MLDKYTCLEKLANQRSDEVVVTTMSVAMPWATHSDGPLDFAHVESAMGHAADFAHQPVVTCRTPCALHRMILILLLPDDA